MGQVFAREKVLSGVPVVCWSTLSAVTEQI